MKRLYLLRHAKSSKDDSSLSDAERPLMKRGKRDADRMGVVLRERGVKPGVIISSHAVRALKTARLVWRHMDHSPKKIVIDKRVYNAVVWDLLKVVRMIKDNADEVMLVGHNPGITSFADYLAPCGIESIPTCGVVCIGFDTDSWRKVKRRSGRCVFKEGF